MLSAQQPCLGGNGLLLLSRSRMLGPVKEGVDEEFTLGGSGGILLTVPQALVACLHQGLRE